MHPIEPHLPALNRYAKSLVKGKHHIDYRDVVNEAVLACLVANPEELTEKYVMAAARSRAFNIFRKSYIYEDYTESSFLHNIFHPLYVLPYDTEEMYEEELLHNWASSVIAQRCPRGENTKERDRERRKNYLKEYRKKKKNEEQKAAA